ncbi:MAG: TIGR02757 family protein [Holophagales bacterium]|jgi:uncharacterized protein (TIGR02757 family)|nr:TIGR02757 family protein [Holophagales bacterium]
MGKIVKNAASSGLKDAMDQLCQRYQTEAALVADPISIPAKYHSAIDKELASWVAAHLAYGRVAPMLRAIRRALEPLGENPAKWVRGSDESAIRDSMQKSLEGWVWRFHTLEDMIGWIIAWKRLDGSTGNKGLEPLLLPADGLSAEQRLSGLINHLRQSLPSTIGLRFNLPDPQRGAAAKRWRMFLRWMARKGWPDFGVWENYPAEALVIPLDTHVHRISLMLGLCARRAQDLKTALEITNSLKQLDPKDPLRYDFAIAHVGILNDCTRKKAGSCGDCCLGPFCKGRTV